MEIKTKVCPKCGVEKELTAEYWTRRSSSKTGFRTSKCRECFHTEEYRKYNREYQRGYALKHKRSHKYSTSDLCHERRRIKKAQLADFYVRDKLARCGFKTITPELIELKRQQILAKRLLKQFKQWRETNEPDSTNVQGQQQEDEAAYGQ